MYRSALFVKNVKDAMKVRSRLQEIVEMVSLPNMAVDEQRELLHIAVVGGGPTGVEISAEMTDLIHDDFSIMYPHLRDMFSITIHDVAPQILSMFDQKLAEHALDSFHCSSVEVKTGSHITKVEPNALYTAEDGKIRYGMLIWATGNKQVPLVDRLSVSKSNGFPRILTDEYLRPLDLEKSAMSNAFAIGDAADIKGGELPTTAEVACQKGSYVAKMLNGRSAAPFDYQQRALVAYTRGSMTGS
jgi:NADH:ubiquinone reductase (non-electrogenic)